jgi:radical SAM superfamily enzyme YgiQ (UPF0313 family)
MSSNFIIGLPEETEESIKETFEYLMSDQNPLDLFSFSPLIIVPSNAENQSKMEINPEKYGYKVERGNVWANDKMNYNKAKEIGMELYNRYNLESRAKFPTVTVAARILSLNYTVDEIFELLTNKNIDVKVIKQEINKRTNDLKDKYYQELLRL